MVGCCAPGCSRRTENGVRFFGFPMDPKRRKQWEIMTNRPHWTPTLHSKLCQFHFEDHMFKRKEPNWRLKPNAVPTLFLHNQFPIEDMLGPEAFSIPGVGGNGDKVDPLLLAPEPTPELAAHDHSYISHKKKSTPPKPNSALPGGPLPPVGQEVEIPSEITGRLIANFEDYQIIQTTEPSDLIFSEADVRFTIEEESGGQLLHSEEQGFDEEVLSRTLSDGGENMVTLGGEMREEEEDVLVYEEDEESTPVEAGPSVVVSSCDDLCFRLRVSVSSLQNSLAKVTKERDGLRNKLRKEKRRSKCLEKQLMNQSVIPSFLQDDQLKYLQKGSHRGFAWSEETIKQANELKMACGTRGYIALLMHNFPLPGLSTLRSNKRKENEAVVGTSSNDLNAELSLDTDEIEVQLS